MLYASSFSSRRSYDHLKIHLSFQQQQLWWYVAPTVSLGALLLGDFYWVGLRYVLKSDEERVYELSQSSCLNHSLSEPLS